MSYQVLARKWRPKSFEQLVGQKHTAKALINALESQRLHHAYLFTGTRGVGKTTIARILSKSLNCEVGITSNPCGECSSCTEIDQGNFVDLMEIDAASKTKVEDTRELLDNVQYRPTRGRYKVYLIDEVHMLSGHSFNALLKTLEEPPPHVVFLLATTDPQKLPVTVLSRCLQFHLKRMEHAEIVEHLSMILKEEKIDFELDALQPIAKGADGSMRDALSLLDQAIAFSGEKLLLSAVLEMLGSIDQSYCFQLLQSIQNNNAAELMAVIQEMSQYSPDYFEVMSDWLSLLHQIAVTQAIGHSDNEQVNQLSQTISAADLQLYYQISLQAKKDLAFAPHPRQGFEMALLRVLAFKPHTKLPNNIDSEKKKLSSICKNTTNVSRFNTENIKEKEKGFVNFEPSVKSKIKLTPNDTTHLNTPSNQNALREKNHSDSNNRVNIPEDNFVNTQTNVHLLKTKIKEIDPLVNYVEINDTNNSSERLKPSIKSLTENVTNNSSKRLYPEVTALELVKINHENWHYVVDQMNISGNGKQVLLNSLALYEDNQLKINHLKKVTHFLTNNLRQSLTKKIKQNFLNKQFNVEFNEVDKLTETPKDKQIKQHEEEVNNVYQHLTENPCVAKLQQTMGVTIDRASIQLK